MRDLLEIAEDLKKLSDEVKSISCDCGCENETTFNDKVKLSTLNPGDVIVGDSGTEFVVLEHFHDGSTAVISKGFMIESQVFDEDEPYFEESSILNRIKEKCVPIIEDDFGFENIIPFAVDFTTIDNQKRYETNLYHVRLITFEEARKYNELLVNVELNDWWWTLTPWSTADRDWKYSLVVVSPRGGIDGINCYDYFGVRPFLYLKSNIFVSKGDK